MKIQLLIPFIVDSQMHKYLREFVPQDVDIVGLKHGPVGETRADAALTLPEELEAMVKAEKDGYDAIVVGCHGDPGVQEGRELVNIPIVGCMHIGLHICAILGHRFCILTPSEAIKKWIEPNVRACGFDRNRASVRTLSFSAQEAVSQYWEYKRSGKPGDLIEKLVVECVHAIEDDDVTVLTIGCGGLLWTPNVLREELKKRGYDMPFVNPIPAAIEITKGLVTLGLTHSRLAYPRVERGD